VIWRCWDKLDVLLIRRRKGRLSILFFQFESPVKLSEVCSKYEQLGQLVGVQTQRLVALQESGTDDDFSKQYDVLFTMQEFLYYLKNRVRLR
jgi:hypothetical protein